MNNELPLFCGNRMDNMSRLFSYYEHLFITMMRMMPVMTYLLNCQVPRALWARGNETE
jgi:hypothetical protein